MTSEKKPANALRRTGLRLAFAASLAAVAIACSVSHEEPQQSATAKATDGVPTLSLRVADKSAQAPIAGASIKVIDANAKVVQSLTADDAGHASIRFPASGKYSITATKRGYSLGVAGVDTTGIPNGDVYLSVNPLQGLGGPGASGDAPGNADVSKEIGRSVIESSGSSTTTMYYFQGPAIDAEHYSVPLFGAPGRTYQITEVDAATLQTLTPTPEFKPAPADGIFDHELSPTARRAMGAQGVLVAITYDAAVPLAPAAPVAPPAGAGAGAQPKDGVVVPVGGGGTVGVGTGFPDTCGPPGATCVQYTQSTGNIQTYCPPSTNPPYCSVSFSATVGVAVNAEPFGVGVTVSGSVTVGAGVNVYVQGYGTFECKVRATACAWKEPGHWVAHQGWRVCWKPIIGFYPCYDVWNVWVADPCQPGGIQPYPNLGLANGMCTCFNWSVSEDKIRDCPNDGGADCGTPPTADAGVVTKEASAK
jgi:hypothetical protein